MREGGGRAAIRGSNFTIPTASRSSFTLAWTKLAGTKKVARLTNGGVPRRLKKRWQNRFPESYTKLTVSFGVLLPGRGEKLGGLRRRATSPYDLDPQSDQRFSGKRRQSRGPQESTSGRLRGRV